MEKLYTAKTLEEALELAQQELGHDEFSHEVVEMPSKGFLGIGAKMAVIKVTYAANPAGCAREYLVGLFSRMEITDYELNITVDEEKNIAVQVTGEGANVLQRSRGEGVDALQLLLSLVVSKECGEYYKISFNVNDYKERTKERLEALAAKTAAQVLRQHRRVTLQPMTSFQRRIIHSALVDIKDISTHSIGEDPNRRVVVSYTGTEAPMPPRKPRDGSRPSEGNRRPGGNRNGGKKPSYRDGNRDRRPPRKTEETTDSKPFAGEITRLPGEKLSGAKSTTTPISGGTPFNMK